MATSICGGFTRRVIHRNAPRRKRNSSDNLAHARAREADLNSENRAPEFFTVGSTVVEVFAAKLRNSAKRRANQFG
jgi:hypothetical protein